MSEETEPPRWSMAVQHAVPLPDVFAPRPKPAPPEPEPEDD
jgi:hypothetical protein